MKKETEGNGEKALAVMNFADQDSGKWKKHARNGWNAEKNLMSSGARFPLLLQRYSLAATFREIWRLILQSVVESKYTTPTNATLR
jgi:hypothetical protein